MLQIYTVPQGLHDSQSCFGKSSLSEGHGNCKLAFAAYVMNSILNSITVWFRCLGKCNYAFSTIIQVGHHK
jgi:hypothetical protein